MTVCSRSRDTSSHLRRSQIIPSIDGLPRTRTVSSSVNVRNQVVWSQTQHSGSPARGEHLSGADRGLSSPVRALLGHDQELGLISAFLEEDAVVGGVLLVVGEPGLGKTALLNSATATEAGTRCMGSKDRTSPTPF